MTVNTTRISRAWSVTKRVLTAVFLGYILANTTGTALALALSASEVSGVVVGTLLTFPFWAVSILYVFSAPSLKKAVIGLGGAIVVTGGVAGLLFVLTHG